MLSGTALILDIVFAIRNNFTGKRTALHLAGILSFRVVPLTLTAENSCKCNVMVMYSLILDLAVVTESINGNSIQFNGEGRLASAGLSLLALVNKISA